MEAALAEEDAEPAPKENKVNVILAIGLTVMFTLFELAALVERLW